LNIKRNRGRPQSKVTHERLRIAELLKELPSYLPPVSAEELEALNASAAANEEIRQQIIKDFRHGASTPNQHAYDMASLGDESLEGYESSVLARDKQYQKAAQAHRKGGAKANADESSRKVTELGRHFGSLLAQAKPNGPLPHTEVARRMRHSWPMNSMLGDPPKDRTLRSWIKRAIEAGPR
jgi:hypothetical protein